MSTTPAPTDDPKTTVRAYYNALRNGDPLESFFLKDESTVKFGISERLFGYEAVANALQEQTETTEGWTVESSNLTVTEHGDRGCAMFGDEVTMAWTDSSSGARRGFRTRWSGTLIRLPVADAEREGEGEVDRSEEGSGGVDRSEEGSGGVDGDGGSETEHAPDESEWVFGSMHVSTDDEV
ncbi:uncharacterized protein Nmag_1063 [Natrialba magadii ATCC 43099]|uniref:SnoaL-like domain-containing protein n=1 Tax=Natrialba magadii (strain ATCC 43099 / DSM 3394 / CCM 3739 / CIP 104546 / IAM 13178 / JCM 8861 / NBRC 102185 / NCIMB 2190 / MS3) TaxID=547559 RepID=D3SRE2_NATMM|nr:nuclear transport factor 2 family protein [Natrialba magadii]ADD04647.1 uncharacterized protein Nmag_1063 [Natrialba magadii ATCC 43099]ELY25302.1 hypothetical protein C500_17831 [Natrialba magadii ATCC 43099]